MFTGIVDHCGEILEIDKRNHHLSLTIGSEFKDLSLGESIAVDGACLTVSSYRENTFTVEVSLETIFLTSVSTYKTGTLVNLERSLRLTDRLGGHFVTGHIDGLCWVNRIESFDEFTKIVFDRFFSHFSSFLIKKGSVAVNGVSLTINEVGEDDFSIMLIPHTLHRTNLSKIKVDDPVNIEFDYLAKLVFNQINSEKA